jgi:hypothetical protein
MRPTKSIKNLNSLLIIFCFITFLTKKIYMGEKREYPLNDKRVQTEIYTTIQEIHRRNKTNTAKLYGLFTIITPLAGYIAYAQKIKFFDKFSLEKAIPLSITTILSVVHLSSLINKALLSRTITTPEILLLANKNDIDNALKSNNDTPFKWFIASDKYIKNQLSKKNTKDYVQKIINILCSNKTEYSENEYYREQLNNNFDNYEKDIIQNINNAQGVTDVGAIFQLDRFSIDNTGFLNNTKNFLSRLSKNKYTINLMQEAVDINKEALKRSNELILRNIWDLLFTANDKNIYNSIIKSLDISFLDKISQEIEIQLTSDTNFDTFQTIKTKYKAKKELIQLNEDYPKKIKKLANDLCEKYKEEIINNKQISLYIDQINNCKTKEEYEAVSKDIDENKIKTLIMEKNREIVGYENNIKQHANKDIENSKINRRYNMHLNCLFEKKNKTEIEIAFINILMQLMITITKQEKELNELIEDMKVRQKAVKKETDSIILNNFQPLSEISSTEIATGTQPPASAGTEV